MSARQKIKSTIWCKTDESDSDVLDTCLGGLKAALARSALRVENDVTNAHTLVRTGYRQGEAEGAAYRKKAFVFSISARFANEVVALMNSLAADEVGVFVPGTFRVGREESVLPGPVPTQIVAPVELLYRNITCSVRSRSLVAKETAQEMFGILTKQWEAMHPEATNVFSRPRALHITESAERAKTGFKFKFFVCVPSERAFECAEKLNSAAAAKGLSHFRPGGWTVGKAEELDAEYWLARREELVAQEMERPVNVAYIDQHPELSWSHRTNVIIFILDMVFNEEWSIATQHAAIRIFDFFMSRASNVPRNRLEHIAMASATLAAKLHDVEIINLSHLSDAYLGNDEANIPTKIAELEQLALGAAVWDPNISLNMTTPYSYFEFLCSEEDAGFEQLVSLLCHCAILHNETLLLTMADLVSGAIVIAKKLLQFEDPWDQRDIKMMGLSARAAAENANFVTSAVSSVKDDLSSNKHVFRTNPNFEFIEQLLRE